VDPVIAPSVAIFQANSRLFERAVDDLSAEQLVRSASEASNPILWIAGHVANTRFGLSAMLGRKLHRPWGDIFNRSATRPAADAYPQLSVIRGAWIHVGTALMARFEELTDAELRAPAPRPFPIPDKSMRGVIAFLAYHEGYHLGQMSYVRKWLGLPGLMD
jgi:DinB superfamily